MLEQLTGNFVISKADALMCVVLSKVETHARYSVSVGTTEHFTAYINCR